MLGSKSLAVQAAESSCQSLSPPGRWNPGARCGERPPLRTAQYKRPPPIPASSSSGSHHNVALAGRDESYHAAVVRVDNLPAFHMWSPEENHK